MPKKKEEKKPIDILDLDALRNSQPEIIPISDEDVKLQKYEESDFVIHPEEEKRMIELQVENVDLKRQLSDVY